MLDTVKDIERRVREAAKKKQQEEQSRNSSAKQSHIDVAVEQRKQFEEEIKKEKADYGRLFYLLLGTVFLFALWFPTFHTIRYFTSLANREVWIAPKVSPGDREKIESFVNEKIIKAKTGPDTEAILNKNAPEAWRNACRRILGAPDLNAFKVSEVVYDAKNLGTESRFEVLAAKPPPHDSKIRFLVELDGDSISVVNAVRYGKPPEKEQGKGRKADGSTAKK